MCVIKTDVTNDFSTELLYQEKVGVVVATYTYFRGNSLCWTFAALKIAFIAQ